MLINCTYCNEEFNKKPSQIKKSKNHFCNKSCYDKWQTGQCYPERSNKVSHNCHDCNKEIKVENYKYKQFLNGEIKDLFCDKYCLANFQKESFKGINSSRYSQIVKNCESCSQKYSVPKSRENISNFCSHECLTDSKRNQIELSCDYCSVNFIKKPSLINKHNFCCKECSSNWSSETNNIQISKSCMICKKEYKINNNRSDSNKTCSKKCHYIWISEHYAKTEEGRQHYISNGIKSQLNKKYSDTKPERIFKEWLVDNEVEFIPQHPMYDKFVVDFYLPKTNTVVEVFGDYWHGNPKFYGSDKNTKQLTEKQIKQKNKDKAREAYLKKCGHKFFKFWENDIYNNLEEITKIM